MAKKKEKKSDLEQWFDGIDKIHQQQEKEMDDFNAALREPDLLIEADETIYAYWRVEGGFERMRKYPNGRYMPYDRVFISDRIITDLSSLLDKKGVALNGENR